MRSRSQKFSYVLPLLAGALGWFGLILQLTLLLQTAPENGISRGIAILNFFSYFTILTNLLVAISITVRLFFPDSNWGHFFGKTTTQTAIAVYILIVGLVYSIALRRIWNPEGLQLWADRILHDIIPLLYLLIWLLFTPKTNINWQQSLTWLLFPLAYLLVALIRGWMTNWFSYYFLNFIELGWAKVLLNILLISAFFILVSLLLIFISNKKSILVKEN